MPGSISATDSPLLALVARPAHVPVCGGDIASKAGERIRAPIRKHGEVMAMACMKWDDFVYDEPPKK